MNPLDMRSIIDTINNSTITEAPLSQRIKNGITNIKAGFGSNKAKGEVDANNLANKLDTAYQQYLGRTGKSGTIQDLASFLISPSVGFSRSDVENIIKPTVSSIINSPRTEPKVETPQEQPQQAPPKNTQNKPEPPKEEPKAEPEDNNPSEPNEADDAIEEAINQILTYTNRQYSENMSSKTGAKLRRAVLSIANNIADASPEMIKKGGNAALDGVAVLDHSGQIDAGQNGRIQDYLNKILSMDIDSKKPAFNEKPEDVKPDTTNTTSTSDTNTTGTTSTSNTNNKTKPKVTLSSTGKPKVKIPAATESINEAMELSDKEVYDIMKAAAQYAYANDLVGGGNVEHEYDNRSSGYSGGSSNYRSSGFEGNTVGLDKQDQRFMDKVNNRLRNFGITNDEFDATLDLARMDQFEAIQNPADVRSLAIIGYAFLKSIPK